MTSRTIRLVLAGVLGLALTLPLSGPALAHPTWPDQIPLPNGFRPEGITIGRGATAYLGSLGNGDIYAVDLRTGKGRVVSPGPGTASVGLKVDGDLLYVAGGAAGTGRIVNIKTGAIVSSYQFNLGTSFVNDVALGHGHAWFTDSNQPQLYAVRLAKHGKPSAAFLTLPLTGDWIQRGGFNANGIALTPDRKALLVVQSNTGLLFRVNPDTGVAREVDLGLYSVSNGDGLLVEGRTLYVVRNQLNKVDVIRLAKDGRTGTLVRELTSPTFDVPTTVAALGRHLYLPNARFTTPPTPDTEYWITRIARN